MPQVFGTDQIGLMATASLWLEAGYLEDVEDHERALADKGFEHGAVPTHVNREGFHPRGDVWGQHLTSDKTHHTWAIARVANPQANPNAKETQVGGIKPRYTVEIHKVPKNPESARAHHLVTPIWEGNNINHFLEGRPGGGMGWPQVQRAMQTGPRK